MIEVTTESPELADDINYLLLQSGIIAKTYDRKGRPQKRICFADYENLTAFKDIGFLDQEKNGLIYKYLLTNKFSRRNKIPIQGSIKEIIQNTNELSAWRKSESIGENVLLRLKNPEIQELLNSDIFWDKVIKIEEEKDQPKYVYDISVPDAQNFISGFGGIFAHNSEENIRKIFEDAEKNAPSIIFIDEIDAIASKREETKGEVERRVVAQLLALMDGLKSRGKVVVIAATNIPNLLDPALRRPGRFDRELEIGVPDKVGRLNILKIHTRNMPLNKKVILKDIADITYGFVGADLSSLCKESAMIVLRRILPDLKLNDSEEISKEILDKLIIGPQDFKDALKVVRPSAMREVLVEIPNVRWTDIGGLEELKQELIEAVDWPLKHPQAFKRMGVSPPKGVLIYGAPGTGKTMLAKAVASESQANFILVKGPEFLSKWVGESEKAVRKVFEKARQTSPTIIFFDEIDSIAPRRGLSSEGHVTERIVNMLLTEMDGLQELHDVVIIASTNRPDILDTALLRPGRFDRIILAPVPDIKTREAIFKVHTASMPLGKDVNISGLAKDSEGFVGADIEAICREAAISALREDIKANEVNMKHFNSAFKKVKPSVTKEIEKAYADLEDTFRKARGEELKEEKPSYMG
jgi:transitional endoplasmic reticulum ATPase